MKEDLQLLLDASRVMASTLDLGKLLPIIMDLAARVIHAERTSLLLLDERSQELYFDVALGNETAGLKQIRLALGEGIAGTVAKEGKPLVIKDAASDPRWAKRAGSATQFKTKSILCVPMALRGKMLGVIQGLNHTEREHFSEEDIPVFEAFAAQAAVAISNARLFSALKEEKEKIQAAFSGMTEGVVVTETDGTIQQANRVAATFLDAPESWIIGKNISELALTHGFQLTAIETLEEGRISIGEMERKEGKDLILRSTRTRLEDEAGEPIGYMTVWQDVTLAKKEERLKRNFLSTVSHKLKTPLVSILGWSPMLLEEDPKFPLGPMQKKAAQAICSEGEKLSSRVEKLLTFTMVEEDLELSKRPVRLFALVEALLKNLKGAIDAAKGEVILEDSLKVLGPVAVDEQKLEEVFKNLIENGIKFNCSKPPRVRISSELRDGNLHVEITDNGRGIPPEEREKIFQKFYQIEESFTGQVEGVGLGLALAKRVVEAHGGRIWVESAPAQGSKFCFTLPSE